MTPASISAPVQIRRSTRPAEFDHRIYEYESRAVFQRLVLYLRIVYRHFTLKKLINFLRIERDYLLARPVCKGKPWFLKIEPTNVCNLECTYCPRDDTPYGLGMMPLERFESLIDEIKDHTFIVALHLWGEPLLHKQLPAMINYSVRKGIGTYVSSNFNKLSEEQAREIIKSKLDLLTVCVDGGEQGTYEVFRKGGQLSKVLYNIRLFMKIREEMNSSSPYVEMQFLVTPQTQHEIPRVKQLAGELGVDCFKAKPVYPIMIESTGRFSLPAGEHFYPIKKRAHRKTCWWLWRTITIGWEGSVLPCCRVMFAKAKGNVFAAPLSQIWNGEEYQALRRTFVKGEQGRSPCDVCHVPYGSIHG